MDALICPKCRGTMRQYERSGVTVDQCEQCQGIFLDRGELERLTEAEAAYFARLAPQATPPAGMGPGGYPPQQQQDGFLGGLFGGGHHGNRYRSGGHH